jgi:hypothetical protein
MRCEAVIRTFLMFLTRAQQEIAVLEKEVADLKAAHAR